MRVIGIHDINTLYFMDDITIKGIKYYAKEYIDVSVMLDEKAVAEAWKTVAGGIQRRITHERQRDGLEPKSEHWEFKL